VLPSHWASHQVAPDLDWSYYLRRRYLLLLEKWRPIGLVVFGHPPIWLPSAEIFDGVPAGQSAAQRSPQSAAGPGVPNAMTRLGVLAENGAPGTPDFVGASQLYRRASEPGDREASYRLGRLYRDGKGVPQDDGEARHLLEAALEAGHGGVERELAELYEQGRGGPRNRIEALRLYRIAAQEDPWAARAVGRLFAAGDQTASDLSEAAAWLQKAALAGVGWAARDLARLHEASREAEPVPGEVARWYGVALAQGAGDSKLQELVRQRLESLPRTMLVAGAQLLLKEIGYEVGVVDGLPGTRTREALQTFFADSSTDRTDLTPEMVADLARHWRASR
jgi:TPR repeat protein